MQILVVQQSFLVRFHFTKDAVERRRIFTLMNIPFSSTAPTKLYALLLKLRPLQRGTLMPFSGEAVHGALLNWLKTSAPEVETFLHEGNKRRLFTCSRLQFHLPPQRMLDAERDNGHLPLGPDKTS